MRAVAHRGSLANCKSAGYLGGPEGGAALEQRGAHERGVRPGPYIACFRLYSLAAYQVWWATCGVDGAADSAIAATAAEWLGPESRGAHETSNCNRGVMRPATGGPLHTGGPVRTSVETQ